MKEVLSMAAAFAVMVGVIILTYFAAKWYAGRMNPLVKSKYIHIVDRLIVSRSGSILLIDIEGTQYMIGVSENSVQMLEKLEQPVKLPDEAINVQPKYAKIVGSFLSRSKDDGRS
jgi:flagellar protein FliO/FliZ